MFQTDRFHQEYQLSSCSLAADSKKDAPQESHMWLAMFFLI